MKVRHSEVDIPVNGMHLAGTLSVPEQPRGIVLFAHGSGSSRHSTRNRFVADVLQQHGIATLLFDLLTPGEDQDYKKRFDIDLLTERLIATTVWLQELKAENTAPGLNVAYFGASTGAAAALRAAAQLGQRIAVVVSRGGRPDLADPGELRRVTSPTLLIVGECDKDVLELNRQSFELLRCAKELFIVPGATHLFEEPGTLEQAANQAAAWFLRWLPPESGNSH